MLDALIERASPSQIPAAVEGVEPRVEDRLIINAILINKWFARPIQWVGKLLL
jgi:hypothetical protein